MELRGYSGSELDQSGKAVDPQTSTRFADQLRTSCRYYLAVPAEALHNIVIIFPLVRIGIVAEILPINPSLEIGEILGPFAKRVLVLDIGPPIIDESFLERGETSPLKRPDCVVSFFAETGKTSLCRDTRRRRLNPYRFGVFGHRCFERGLAYRAGDFDVDDQPQAIAGGRATDARASSGELA
jgi:hypothetical protein